jgi:hypothetical protein
VTVPRPFRAVATEQNPEDPAGRHLVVRRVAAKTRGGLDRFVGEHEAEGRLVTIVEVGDLLDAIEGGEDRARQD